MSNIKSRIEDIKNHGYELDFTTVFNYAFEVYKKIALNVGVIFLLISLILGGIVIVIFGFVIGFGTLGAEMQHYSPGQFSPVHMTFYILGLAIFSALMSPINAGILKMAYDADQKREISMAAIFHYYKDPYFKELFLATFLVSLLTVGSSTLMDALGIKLVGTLLTIAVSFFNILTVPIIIFGNLKAIDALKASLIVVSKNPIMILGLLIIGILASLVGIVAFCIGIFFTIPFGHAIYYSIYVHAVGIVEEEDKTENDFLQY